MTGSIQNISPWRKTAAAVVEELFQSTTLTHWDDLLDFRESLLNERDWRAVLSDFSKCREELEDDHYLPFYRLRRLLSAHVKLEGVAGIDISKLLRNKKFPQHLLKSGARLVEA